MSFDFPFFVQVGDSVTCMACDGWSLLAGDTQGRLHVIEVIRTASQRRASHFPLPREFSRHSPPVSLAQPLVLQVAGRCAGTCIDVLKSHTQAVLSINGTAHHPHPLNLVSLFKTAHACPVSVQRRRVHFIARRVRARVAADVIKMESYTSSSWLLLSCKRLVVELEDF